MYTEHSLSTHKIFKQLRKGPLPSYLRKIKGPGSQSSPWGNYILNTGGTQYYHVEYLRHHTLFPAEETK